MSNGIYKIASFNMFKFSLQSDDEIRKNFNSIAKIINNEQFDVVGMQEVLNENAIKRLLPHLNGHWEYRWICPRCRRKQWLMDNSSDLRSVQAAEGFAFLWKSERLELSYSLLNLKSYVNGNGIRTAEPSVYDRYKIDSSKGQQDLLRNPFYIRLKPKGLFFEFRIINTHIRYGKQKDDDLSQNALRQNEFNVLTEEILARECDRRYGNFMPSLTILLGDYNLNLKKEFNKCIPPYLCEEKIVGRHTIVTVQPQRSTLKKEDDFDEDARLRGLSNNFDHFSYNKKRMSQFLAGEADTVKAVGEGSPYYGTDYEGYRREVSDHLPIVLTIDFKGSSRNAPEDNFNEQEYFE